MACSQKFNTYLEFRGNGLPKNIIICVNAQTRVTVTGVPMENKMRITARLTLMLLLFVAVSIASPKVIEQPTDHAISLSGILRIVHGLGPPGYGEDKNVDIKISYWVLDLPFKVTVACTPTRADLADIECGSTSRIRLFFPVEPPDKDLESRARKLIGHKATVTGILQRRTAMIEITPVYMKVADIMDVQH
jgi:hypothetical protein